MLIWRLLQNSSQKKTDNGEENLLYHCIKSAVIAEHLANEAQLSEELKYNCILASLFHDIGKITENWQKHCRGTNIQYIPHNYVSANFLHSTVKGIEEHIINSILYHHPLYNTDSFAMVSENINDIQNLQRFALILSNVYTTLTGQKLVFSAYDEDNELIVDGEYFKKAKYLDDGYNKKLIIHSLIIKGADIMASNNDIELSTVISKNYNYQIPSYYDQNKFSEQDKIAFEAYGHKLSHVEAATGYGKTLVSLLYFLKGNKKLMWVCPRNAIAEGIFKNVINEINALSLTNNITVALLLSGEYKYGDENADIIVTNIDNFFDPNISTKSNNRGYAILTSDVIFDEYHEYVSSTSIMAAFIEILRARIECNSSHTLLLSATPCKKLFNCLSDDTEIHYIKIEECREYEKQVKIKFVNKLPNNFNTNTLVSLHTVGTAQDAFLDGHANVCHHARFTESDFQENINLMYQTHGKTNNINTSWVGTSVISTGIDASWNSLTIIYPTPEGLLQSMGRANRWGLSKQASEITIVCDENLKSEVQYLKNNGLWELVQLYVDFLKKNITDEVIPLKELYDLNKKFYKDSTTQTVFNRFFKKMKNDSYENLSQLTYSKSSKKNKDNYKHISQRKNLRSNGTKQIFITVRDINTGLFIEPIQMDISLFGVTENTLRSSINSDFFKYLKNNWQNYFANKYIYDNFMKKKDFEQFSYLFKKSSSSQCPYPITVDWGYDKKLGLFKLKKLG